MSDIIDLAQLSIYGNLKLEFSPERTCVSATVGAVEKVYVDFLD